MLRPLHPDAQQFRVAYASWIEKTSQLMASSAEGTTFGIFGPWGSGKTSAIKALQPDVLRAARAPLQDKATLAAAYVDCSGLRSDSEADVSTAVHAELVRSGLSERNSALESRIFTFFRKALPVLGVAMPDPRSQAAVAAATALAEAGQHIADERQAATVPEIPTPIEKAFIFLDDLDRCDADAAWAILRHVRRALPKTKTVFAIVCDPAVLGHHIAHALGVPLASGFQAVLKYIDIPLKIPTAFTEAHRESIDKRLEPRISEDWKLGQVACAAVGNIPLRDILAALPQACVWLASWDSKLRPTKYGSEDTMKSIAEVVFFCSLMHICIPNAAQVIASGKRDWLEFSSSIQAISNGNTGPMADSTQSAIQKGFGGIVQEVIGSRMDLIRYGRSLDLGKKLLHVRVGAEQNEVWPVLWDMVRN